ncbi:MAG: hypothetical protein ACRDTD_26210 [Pseudonocardiaceae bacterium]
MKATTANVWRAIVAVAAGVVATTVSTKHGLPPAEVAAYGKHAALFTLGAGYGGAQDLVEEVTGKSDTAIGRHSGTLVSGSALTFTAAEALHPDILGSPGHGATFTVGAVSGAAVRSGVTTAFNAIASRRAKRRAYKKYKKGKE